MRSSATRQINFLNTRESEDSSWKSATIAMWKKFVPGLRDDELQKRLNEVVFVLRDNGGNVIGVSTAYKLYVERLRNYFYAFRCFVAPNFRMPGLTSAIIIRTRDYLESVHATDGSSSERCVGMITIVENKRFNEHRREAVWPASKMMYIGETGGGHQIRVYYF